MFGLIQNAEYEKAIAQEFVVQNQQTNWLAIIVVVATIATVIGMTLCFYMRDESSKRDWRPDSGRTKTLFRTNASEI